MKQELRQLKHAFPHMINELDKGNVWSWNNMGYSGELQPKHKRHIADLEARHRDLELKVYAVLDNYMLLGGSEEVHMTSYLFVCNDESDISPYSDDIYYAIADVVNETWDINEMGSVLIQGGPTGGPRRVG